MQAAVEQAAIDVHNIHIQLDKINPESRWSFSDMVVFSTEHTEQDVGSHNSGSQ